MKVNHAMKDFYLFHSIINTRRTIMIRIHSENYLFAWNFHCPLVRENSMCDYICKGNIIINVVVQVYPSLLCYSRWPPPSRVRGC